MNRSCRIWIKEHSRKSNKIFLTYGFGRTKRKKRLKKVKLFLEYIGEIFQTIMLNLCNSEG